jgi:hypothetical protein
MAGIPPRRWRQERAVLAEHRHRLSGVAARLYPGLPQVAGTGLLCRQEWLAPAPVALDGLALAWTDRAPDPVADGTGPVSSHVRPARPGGGAFPSYAEAIAALDPPVLLENRVCYRPLAAALAGSPALTLSKTSYFDAVSLGHAVAHELAAAWQAEPGGLALADLPLRSQAGDPCDLPRRPAILAVAALTLRRTPAGAASFVLHWRDPAKVNHGGGLYQVMPVGLFQPVSGTPAGIASDLSLWRCLAREYSEEFLGGSEDYHAPGGVLDYGRWPFWRRLEHARQAGKLTVHCVGMGVDPLTFATDLLTVAVFDADVYDAAFGALVTQNAEGVVIGGGDGAGIPLDAGTVARFTGGGEPIQASGAALLSLAWRHRRHLLG